jgi:hypothetical protein
MLNTFGPTLLSRSPVSHYTCARIYRPSFHENEPETLVFSHTKREFWAYFRENWVYNFRHCIVSIVGFSPIVDLSPNF